LTQGDQESKRGGSREAGAGQTDVKKGEGEGTNQRLQKMGKD